MLLLLAGISPVPRATALSYPFIFVSYYCMTNKLKIQWPKAIINNCYLTYFPWIRNPRDAQLSDFSSGQLQNICQGCHCLDRGWMICLRDAHSHGCWGGDLSSSPHGHLHRAPQCLHGKAAGFPQSWGAKRKQGRSHNIFYDLISEITLCHFYNILLVTQVSPI